MKRLTAILLTCFTLIWFGAFAQDHPGGDAQTRAKKLTDLMTSSLQLTSDQVPKVQEINLRYAQQVDDLRLSTMTKEEKKSKFKSMVDAKDAELKGVFTEDQYKSYQAKKKEFEKRMNERMKERNKAGIN
jgi:hypothetical protein